MNLPLKSLRVSRKEILDKNSIKNEKIEFSSKPTSYLPAMKKMSIQNDPPETGLVHPIFSFCDKKIVVSKKHDKLRGSIDLSQSFSFDNIDNRLGNYSGKVKPRLERERKENMKFKVNFKMPKQVLRSNLEIIRDIKHRMGY
ncbi:unnamed protein product [Moneuplotes crassus]|uniref:Uncharacterized protein n=1 Tax=Euplotes crassus TaxID=5936 RepID=A0AAD1X624_EUPCR|nr:unnamed protein product [Moneuplotes crassus]